MFAKAGDEATCRTLAPLLGPPLSFLSSHLCYFSSMVTSCLPQDLGTSSASYMLCDNRQVLEPLYKMGSLSCHTADLVSLGGSSHRPWHHTLEAQEVLQTDPTVKGLQNVPWSLGDQFLRGKDHGVFP